MNPVFAPIIGGLAEAVSGLIDDLVTTDKEKLDAEIELRRLGLEEMRVEADLAASQTAVNAVESAHPNVFVSGWRPAVGWVGVAAMAYQFVLYPFLVWAWAMLQAVGWVPGGLNPPPILDTDALWVILTGILGLGTARTVEKIKRVTS
jgi:Holin of 3TMs, for gene-transfer release